MRMILLTMSKINGHREKERQTHIQLQVMKIMARRVDSQTKWKDVPGTNANSLRSDDDLNALLKEEEDLVIAHQRQVEDTINIVREEMRLLDEADQPGNQLDDYISRLNTILSQKAAGIVNLQARLAHFQRRSTEHNVLVSSMGP